MRFVTKYNLFPRVQFRKFAKLLQNQPELLVRHAHGPEWSEWFFVLDIVDDSCLVLWPAQAQMLTNAASSANELPHGYYVPAEDINASHATNLFVPMLDVSKWQAMSVAWYAPLRQAAEYPGKCNQWGVRAFATGTALPLLKVCASHAFFTLDLAFLKDLADDQKINYPDGAGLFDVLWALVKKVLRPINDKDALNIILKRAVRQKRSRGPLGEMMLEMNDSFQALTKADQEVFKEEVQSQKNRAAETKKFLEAYRSKRAKVFPAPNPDPPKKKAKKSDAPAPARLKVPANEELSQKDLKPLTPANTFIWISRGSRQWCCRYPPAKPEYYAWSVYGSERNAALEALKSLWSTHIEHGCGPCLIDGLFEPGAAETLF